MNKEIIENKLSELGLTLPEAPAPVAVYVPAVAAGPYVFVSGQLPMKNGELTATGLVGTDVTIAAAQQAARQCAINAIAAVGQALGGDFERVKRVVKLEVFVAGDADFTSHHLVANGASELMGAVFGEQGIHARAAVGVAALPLNAAVEVAAIILID